MNNNSGVLKIESIRFQVFDFLRAFKDFNVLQVLVNSGARPWLGELEFEMQRLKISLLPLFRRPPAYII